MSLCIDKPFVNVFISIFWADYFFAESPGVNYCVGVEWMEADEAEGWGTFLCTKTTLDRNVKYSHTKMPQLASLHIKVAEGNFLWSLSSNDVQLRQGTHHWCWQKNHGKMWNLRQKDG